MTISYIFQSALVCNTIFVGLLVDKGLHGNILYIIVCNNMFVGLLVDKGLHGNILYPIYYILRSALVCNNMFVGLSWIKDYIAIFYIFQSALVCNNIFVGLLVDKGLHGNILYISVCSSL